MYNFPVIPESFLSSLNSEAKSSLYDLQAKLAQEKESPSVLSSNILPDWLLELLLHFVSQILPDWLIERNYIINVIVTTLFKVDVVHGGRLALPLLDKEKLNKQDALPYQYWGLLYDDWEPKPAPGTSLPAPADGTSVPEAADGTSVFITGYDHRGENNKRKRIYYSAITPDLYTEKYHRKVSAYFQRLLSSSNASTDSPKPLMQIYLDTYFDLYWDLHLGNPYPPQDYKDIGTSFNTVLAHSNPMKEIVYNNYLKVRNLRPALIRWIYDQLDDASCDPTTFVYYWLKNSNEGLDESFRRKDIAFECFHNFLAFSQWGNTIYKIVSLLSENEGNQCIKDSFQCTMQNPDTLAYKSFTNLDLFVMELFRWISPNTGSISKIDGSSKQLNEKQLYEEYRYIITPHKETSYYDIHWENAEEFKPDRYEKDKTPTSDDIGEQTCTNIGFAQCPFHKTDFPVSEQGGRNINLTNSGFGTVYSETADASQNNYSVIEYAGYAPFGFGYRRCAGEQFTVEVIKDFLKIVHSFGINFKKLEIQDPEEVPVAPGTTVPDEFGFTISAVN